MYYLPVNMFIEFVPVRFRINLAETEMNQRMWKKKRKEIKKHNHQLVSVCLFARNACIYQLICAQAIETKELFII